MTAHDGLDGIPAMGPLPHGVAHAPDDPEIADLGTLDLLALRVEIRAQISHLLNEKRRLSGQIHATASGTAWAGTADERGLRGARAVVNRAITRKTGLLDRVKLRIFELQGPPRPKAPPDPRATTAAERAERLAALESSGPDALLLRLARVVRRVLDAAGAEMLADEDRRALGDVSFYLRQKVGSSSARDRIAAGS